MTASAPTAPAKSALRDAARAARAKLAPDVLSHGAARLAEIGLGFAKPRNGAAIAGYHPVGGELDPLPLLARLSAAGFATALPVVAANGDALRFRAWRPGEPVVEGSFAISEPPPEAPHVEPDILLVPLLAFDSAGHRLGYGGGYYDRALARLRRGKRIVAIGLAFDEQEIARIPHEATDQALDFVLTPSGPRAIES